MMMLKTIASMVGISLELHLRVACNFSAVSLCTVHCSDFTFSLTVWFSVMLLVLIFTFNREILTVKIFNKI